MNLVFLGPPGAGKGTAASQVSKRLGVCHISTGDMFRAAIKNGTPVGLKAKAFIDRGELVPDFVTVEMVAERLGQADCANGFLLDGFPRTVEQAQALDSIAAVDAVIDLVVEDEPLVARLTGRRVCPECRGTYHISRLADEKICPDCASELVHRPDDHAQTIQARLDVYHKQTSPLTDYYKTRGILRPVDASATPDEVLTLILKALESDR